MKKQLISAVLVASALAVASAQTPATNTTQQPAPLPPMLTGDSTIDAQIKALNQEMEAKIKAIRDDYRTRIQALVGTRASSTPRGPRGEGERGPRGFGTTTAPQWGQGNQGDRGGRGGDQNRGPRPQVEGAQSDNQQNDQQQTPQGNAWGFFQRFFGGFGRQNG